MTVDTLRGLACLLLVAFHVVGHAPDTGLELPDDHLMSQVNQWLVIVRMPLFSFLSGLVYALRPLEGATGPFIVGKTRRLLLPMLLVGTGFAILQALTPGANGGVQDWRLLHIVPVAHYWFLESLFLIFVLTALLERLSWLSTPGRFAMVWVASAALHAWGPMPAYFGLQGATFLLPFFLMGVAAHRFPLVVGSSRASAAALAVLVGVALSWTVTGPSLDDPTSIAMLAVSVCSCLLLLRLRPQARWLAWIGTWSFGIYLFHPVFTAASRIALQRLGVQELALLFTAGLVAGLAGPIALTAVLRRLPLGHLPLGERPRRRNRAAAADTAAPAPSASSGETAVRPLA